MGSVEFECSCGFRFLSASDNRSYQATLLADQDVEVFWELLDRAIEESGESARDREQACMDLRVSLFRTRHEAWQCPACKRVYLMDQAGRPHAFSPDGDPPGDLLAGRGIERRTARRRSASDDPGR